MKIWCADVAELADALGSGPSSFTGVGVQVPPSAPFFVRVRVWHNGCAPAFQAGYTGSTPVTRSKSGGIAERSKAADCKSALSEFDGSNPSPTTISFLNFRFFTRRCRVAPIPQIPLETLFHGFASCAFPASRDKNLTFATVVDFWCMVASGLRFSSPEGSLSLRISCCAPCRIHLPPPFLF